MRNASKRRFNEGEVVYVIDSDHGKAVCASARILYFSKTRKKFMAVVNDNSYKKYDIEDYGCIIFDTAEEAKQAANIIPVPGEIVYLSKRQKIHKEIVMEICSRHNREGVTEIIIKLLDNQWSAITKTISIKDIGIVLFFNEEDAKTSKN